jgi:CheY-like chemotaxis protein
VPIIAITANAMPEDRAACDAVGMNGFVAKPVRRKDLRQVLERWLTTPLVS